MEIGDIVVVAGFGLNLPDLTAKLQQAERMATSTFKPIPVTFQFSPPSALMTKFDAELKSVTSNVQLQTTAVAALVAEYRALSTAVQGVPAVPIQNPRRGTAMNTEATYARMLKQEVNTLRNAWQAEYVTEAETVLGMQKYGSQAKINLSMIEAQIAALKGLSNLNAAELKQLAELTALQNSYSIALKGTASTINTVNGVITRGSLAAGVSAGVRDAANAITLLNNQYKAGIITQSEFTAGLGAQRSALLSNLTPCRQRLWPCASWACCPSRTRAGSRSSLPRSAS